MRFSTVAAMMLVCSSTVGSVRAQERSTQNMKQDLIKRVNQLSSQIESAPESVQLYSARGDTWFFLGDFHKALADYDEMVELDPAEDRSHWRRGIALFYNRNYEAAAAQFDRYHNFDDVDRENGIWRYLSHFQSKGAAAAAQELLKYDKDDREPFGDVYKLFSSEMTGQEILDKIQAAQISDSEREKRMFYATLYIGLNEDVNGRKELALKFLKQAAGNTWAPKAGYGPHYMWQVARLHASLIEKSMNEGK